MRIRLLSFTLVGLVIATLTIFGIQIPRSNSEGSGKSHVGLESAVVSTSYSTRNPGTLAKSRIMERYGNLPLTFEANQGQTDRQVQFLSQGSGHTLFLTPTQAVLALREPGPRVQPKNPILLDAQDRALPQKEAATKAIGIELVGSNPHARSMGMEELPGKNNYFVGNDASKWRTNVPNFSKVRFENVYPGVDLVYYGNQKNLEHDFIVAPGVDPNSITLAVKTEAGTPQKPPLAINSQGDLIVGASQDELRLQRPMIYQETNGVRQEVAGGFMLKGDNQVGFAVSTYDQTKPLVIDPVLIYSTFLGGSANEIGFAITVNSAGNAYVAGATASADFPLTPGAFQTSFQGPSFPQRGDAFVTELNPAGTGIVFSTYLGGSGNENGRAIALDTAGNVYLAGDTGSSNFPTLNPAQPTFAGGEGDGFVAKLNATGSALIYSTYLGGSGGSSFGDAGNAIVADSAGNAYVAGQTDSTDFPTANALQPTHGGGTFDAFIAKFDSAGSLVFSTFLGGNGLDAGHGIALDASGNIYVDGFAESTNFPTLNPLQASNAGGRDGFVAKLNASGSALIFSTYLGGGATDEVEGLAVDAADNIYVTGLSASTNFPTVNPLQASNAGDFDGFVAKLNAAGTALVYSTYLGGSGFEAASSIAVDSSGNAYITGDTQSSNFPISTGAPQSTFAGVDDAFITKLNAAGSAIVYSTYLGGSSSEGASGIALDPSTNAYVMGTTNSTNFPTTPGAFQVTLGGGPSNGDAFVTKLSAVSSSANFFLHGSGGLANPPTLFLNNSAPTVAAASYKDSAGINFSGGDPWKEIGTWPAAPALTSGALSSLSDPHVWLGLKNSDDQGTRFDLRADILKNGTVVASGETDCIQSVTRNPDLAKEVIVSFGAISPSTFNGTSDVLSVRVLTRIGTNGSGSFCGGHSNAVGLRLYFDAVSRPARFDASF